MLARLLLWRTLGLAAAIVGAVLLAGLLDGELGAALRHAGAGASESQPRAVQSRSTRVAQATPPTSAGARRVTPGPPASVSQRDLAAAELPAAALTFASLQLLLVARWRARRRRRYIRLQVLPYRADRTSVEGLVSMFESLHKRLQQRKWRRVLLGQPSLALEVHCRRDATGLASASLAIVLPSGLERMLEASLRSAYPNCALARSRQSPPSSPPAVLRLRKHSGFIKRVKLLDRFELAREPAMDRLITAMAACEEDVFVQLALTPAPALFERYARRLYKQHEDHLARARREHPIRHDRSLVDDVELRGGLDVQHRPLYFLDLRVLGASRVACERVGSELRAEGAENRLVERRSSRHVSGRYRRRIVRGEGNPWPALRTGVFASTELAALWHLPSVEYATVPFARSALPVAPAPPAIMRATDGHGTLRDAFGAVCIHPELRRQNTAVPGAVEQGKSSYLAATVAADLRREQCAVIVLDPKGDAAEAAVGLVPPERTCTLLDFAHPTCGFNPLAVQAPADTIADYVVGALKNLFTDADIRASSDRYLRNAVIAVLAHDPQASLWDAARLLSVGEDGYAYRARVGAHVRTLPEFKEIAEFFTAELSAQLADSRSTTTAKLDAPVNKLARLLNSASIKRVLLNDSLAIDLDRVIAAREVLVVKGALGAMGAGNTSVLMQLLVGMLDAALARQQDLVPVAERVAVALKVDEAPLVLNRGFAETLALKRSAGLETVACWQTDAQWVDREIRDQLDALFAHRVYFATASARDARDAAKLMMADFADVVRPESAGLSALGRPDARLHLPKHHAIVSWSTPHGRQSPFLAQTIPLHVDRERLALHTARQAARGGRYLADLSQPHWERARKSSRERDLPSKCPPASDFSRESSPSSDLSGKSLPASNSPSKSSPVHDPLSKCPPARNQADAGVHSRASTPAPVAATAPPAQTSSRSVLKTDLQAPLPVIVAESYRELVDLDRAHRVRRAPPVNPPRALVPDPLDIEILLLVAELRHVLTSQIHRRFNSRRATTTTQRRLKRLADAGLLERFQFHRRDGAGAPMCHVLAAAGRQLLETQADPRDPEICKVSALSETPSRSPSSPGSLDARASARRLREARRDVHIAGWLLALEQALGGTRLCLRGPARAALSPPLTATAGGRLAIGPRELRLPGGRTPHGFLRTDRAGARVEVERFETVRPDASIEVAGIELLVELDDRLPSDGGAAKLERYDHLLAGWSLAAPRFARRGAPQPLVVFLCRDRRRARECARQADHVLSACRAYAGEHPHDWEYPGRAAIVFVAERDAHEGSLLAYGVQRLPPDVRASATGDELGACEPVPQPRELLPRIER